MAACNPNTILSSGKAFQALDQQQLRIAQIALLVQWLASVSPGTDVTSAAILSRGKAYQTLDMQGIRTAIYQSLCTISGG